VDPVASLGIWAVEVDLAGRVLRIPPLPAGDWLPVLMRLDLRGVRSLIEDIGLRRMLLDGVITRAQLEDALERLVEGASGRSAWETFALAHLAAENWRRVGGELARRGVRLDLLPLGAALDAIYGTIAAGMDEKGLANLNRVLERQAPSDTPPAVKGPRPPALVPASAEPYVRVRPKTVQRRPQDRLGAPIESPMPPPVLPADSGPADVSAPPPPAAAGHPAA
jgi:hypothetical protein